MLDKRCGGSRGHAEVRSGGQFSKRRAVGPCGGGRAGGGRAGAVGRFGGAEQETRAKRYAQCGLADMRAQKHMKYSIF